MEENKIEKTKEDRLEEIRKCINQNDNLCYIPKKYSKHFEEECVKEGKCSMPLIVDGDFIVYLKTEESTLPRITSPNFNYASGAFEKKDGVDRKTIILTPNQSGIKKVEIEILGMDFHNMKLLPDKTGDVIEDTVRIKITRHYISPTEESENKEDLKYVSRDNVESKQSLFLLNILGLH